MSSLSIEIQGEKLVLLPERAVYWEHRKLLILSDLHLGKAGHFRKHGIPIPRKIHYTDLEVFNSIIQRLKPQEVILLGDLFHSVENIEWQDFLQFRQVYHFLKFTLVEGNHDILREYPKSLQVVPYLEVSPFSFTHHQTMSGLYNLSGHIHPGVQMRGRGRQSITIPCFTFRKDHGILPAFGQFTGIKKIRPCKNDRVFGVVDGSVIELT